MRPDLSETEASESNYSHNSITRNFYSEARHNAIVVSDLHLWEAEENPRDSVRAYIDFVVGSLNDAGEEYNADVLYNLGDTGSEESLLELARSLEFDRAVVLEGDEDREYCKRHEGWRKERGDAVEHIQGTELITETDSWSENMGSYEANFQHFPMNQGHETRSCIFHVDPYMEEIAYFLSETADISSSLKQPAVNFHGHSHSDLTRRLHSSVVNSVGGFRNAYHMKNYDRGNIFKAVSFGESEVDIATLDAREKEVVGAASFRLENRGFVLERATGKEARNLNEVLDETVLPDGYSISPRISETATGKKPVTKGNIRFEKSENF